MLRLTKWSILSALAISTPLPGQDQKPVINPHGIVNAASYSSDADPGGSFTYSAIATIFGSNLSDQVLSASTLPLPRQLGSTIVTLNGVALPLLFVAPSQINFQAPYFDISGNPLDDQFPGPSPKQIVVSTASGSSDPYPFPKYGGPGLFSIDGTGCGQAAALNVDPDGRTSVNGPTNSASPGSFVSIFATGVGALENPPPDGQAPDANHPGRVINFGCCEAVVGQEEVPPSYAALAPGFVGLFQFNFLLPSGTPEGCAIPVKLHNDFLSPSSSQDLSIAVRKGGGPCIDPPKPPSSFGILEWRQTQSSDLDAVPSGETFTATFLDPPDPRFSPPPFPAPAPVQCACRFLQPPGKSCPQFQSRPLDAGSIAIQTPAGDRIDVPRAGLVYQTPLPSGTLRAGMFSATGSGGADVGPFQSSLALPAWPPFTLQTTFPPGTNIPLLQPLVVRWTGGGPHDIVRFQLTGTHELETCECSAPASAGSLTLDTTQRAGFDGKIIPGLLRYPTDTGEIAISMESDDADPNVFSARGLGLGRHRWVYEYRFGQISVHSRPN